MTAPVHVAFEGLDGTGKSRLAELLSLATARRLVATPDPLYAPVRAVVHPSGGAAALLMYLSSCAYAIQGPGAEMGLVLDRFAFSSVVGFGWPAGWTAKQTVGLLHRFHDLVPQPGLTVLLSAERTARLRRLRGRGDRGYGDAGEAFERYWYECADRLRETSPAAATMVLDTSGDDTGPLVDRLLTHPLVRRSSEVVSP